MGAPPKTTKQILAAVKNSRGIKAAIARKLGVHRNSIDNYLKRYPRVLEAYNEEVDTLGDIAESVIIEDIVVNKNVDTAKWFAAKKLKDRGYVERQEVSGKDGGPVQHKHEVEYVNDWRNS